QQARLPRIRIRPVLTSRLSRQASPLVVTTLLQRVAGRTIVGVQVVNEHFRLDREKLLIMPDRVDIGHVSCVLVEGSQMMAEKCMPAPAQCERDLQLPAQRQART